MDKQELDKITTWLIDNVIQNTNIMFNDTIRGAPAPDRKLIDLVDVIVYLHNRLSECVEGSPYDYMFHWANKVGSDVQDAAELSDCIYKDEPAPDDWELSDAEHRTADWIDKQYFQGRGLYIDTDGGEEGQDDESL